MNKQPEQPITLTEYSPTRETLSDDELNYLLDLVRGSDTEDEQRLFESITPTRESGVYQLRAGAFVGRLGLPSGRWIDFRSRFEFDDVIQLIRLSGKIPIRTDTLRTEATSDVFTVDVIAEAFVREIGRLAGRGLAKGYQPKRYTRPPYSGRPDVAFHLHRLGMRPDRLATIARRITLDIPINRAIALALDVLSRIPLAPRVTRGLARLAPAFMRVGRNPMAADDVPRIPLTNLTHRYQDGLSLAELILRSQSLAPRGVGLSGASVLFNMSRVWEGCVARWVQLKWPDSSVEEQHNFDLTAGGELRAAADVVVRGPSRVIALYDAKYKVPHGVPDRGDIYQMVTYCERLGLPEASLVYPALLPERSFQVTGKTIRVVGLPPSEIGYLLSRGPREVA